MKAPNSTARMAAVVNAAGQPEPVTLWVSPQRDKGFQAAVKENRVLTVHQETTGNKKDFGVVGFHKQKNAAYWIFPKPLDRFEGKRIIGVDYGVLKMPESIPAAAERAGPKSKPKPTQAAPKFRPPPAKPKITAVFRYQVKVRCVATVDVESEITAANQREAKEKALRDVEAGQVDYRHGAQSRKVIDVREIPAGASGAGEKAES